MRRLSRLMTGIAMLAVLAGGCGSTDDSRLVLQFIQWDATNITQADAVGPSSASVDIVLNDCNTAVGGTPTAEFFTPTAIDAIFRNNEGSDILLEAYSTEIGDSRLSQINISKAQGSLGVTLLGGRCSNRDQQCAVDNDCGTGLGLCDHANTTVTGIILVDLLGKGQVATVALKHPEVLGQVTPLTVTFYGSDASQSFQTTAHYQLIFGDFDNCSSGGGAGVS